MFTEPSRVLLRHLSQREPRNLTIGTASEGWVNPERAGDVQFWDRVLEEAIFAEFEPMATTEDERRVNVKELLGADFSEFTDELDRMVAEELPASTREAELDQKIDDLATVPDSELPVEIADLDSE